MLQKLFTLFTFLILVTQTILGNDLSSEVKQKAIIDAQNVDTSIHQAYLQCYALKPDEKLNCSKQIIKDAKIHINKELQTNQDYITVFSHEAERLRFVSFLKNNNMSCDKINEGPIFDKVEGAYTVFCTNGLKYYMTFDYNNNLWQLKDNK